jgi:aromatic ring-cleaving dioxygenase
MGDHLYLDGNPMEKVEFFRNRLGQTAFDLLNSRARNIYPKPDKTLLTIYFQQQVKLLDK